MGWKSETDRKINSEIFHNETFVAERPKVIFQTCLIVVFLCEKWVTTLKMKMCKVGGIFMIFRESCCTKKCLRWDKVDIEKNGIIQYMCDNAFFVKI